MLGRVSGFLQGNPVYDYDDNDYIGAYVQDDWRVRAEPDGERRRCAGSRSCRSRTRCDYVSNFDQARFDAGHPEHGLSAGAGRPAVPGRRRASRARRR